MELIGQNERRLVCQVAAPGAKSTISDYILLRYVNGQTNRLTDRQTDKYTDRNMQIICKW